MKKNFFLTLMLALVALFSIDTATAQAPVATPEQAITGLLNRIGGDGAADKFEIVIDANLAENGKDVFVITSKNGKPCIKGNNQLSVATGINWYLNHYAHINLTWNNLTTDLSQVTLPVPGSEEKHVSNATYRYDFNTCTFSYSMAFWTWERWQQEIDWMALHGINAPLNLVGLEVVTRKFLTEIGMSEEDIKAYIAGPGFMAWFAMNNLEGWGGTINANDVTMNGNPDWWYTRQEQLCRNMLQRMRELGMQPVIPGFSGQVPRKLGEDSKYANINVENFKQGDLVKADSWGGGFTHPSVVNPTTESFKNLAKVYYKHLHDVMGVSEFYSIDPFHEMSAPVGPDILYPGIMANLDLCYADEGKEKIDKYNAPAQPKWIVQYWQETPVSGAFGVMNTDSYKERFIALDLFSDAPGKAKWNTDYFQGRPYIFCMLHNFGGRSGMHGRLESTMNDYFRALAKGNNCKGIGATPEGSETNPILYDMLFELPWMDVNNRPTADEWLAEYAHSRYGVKNDNALAALQNLKKSVWACPTDQQGTSEAVILARPKWVVNSVSHWSTSAIYWDTQDVLLAADQLYSVKDLVTANGGQDGIANYNYDFIDVVRQAMVDYAAQLLPLINAARGNDAEYTRLYQLYLQLMLDLDTMLSYDAGFKLERWTSLARNIADEVDGTTVNDRNWLEWNARTQITVWCGKQDNLNDYSNRCWAGLIKDFHYERWKYFFENNGNAPSGGWYSGFEYPWTVNYTDYDYSKVTIPTDMTATAKAAETFGKYFGRVKGAEKNYVFPMGITTNATKSDVIPEVYRGKTVALPLEIGKNVTISSVWIDLNNDGAASNSETLAVTDGNKVAIPADAAIGKTTAKVTYSDGTVITFNLALIEDITENRTVTAVAGANGSVAIEGADGTTVTNALAVKMIATANTGYNFENWTDAQGEVVSNDNPFIYYGKEEATFTANFIQDKWGVVADNSYTSELGTINDYMSFVHNMTFAYYNRDAETIYEADTAPTSVFTTIPQIINVPRGASFDVEYDNGSSNGLKYCYFRAFIDLNADGDFDDEGELLKEVGTNGGENTAVCKNKINVLLPYDAPLGITHMRLRFDGAFSNSNKPASLGAKDGSNRPVYEIILNVTDFSDKAAHITVATNSEEWGTVKVWTDETPADITATEWDVTKGVLFFIAAENTSEDVEFLGWYDHYGRLVTTELEYSMLAKEDATYTARFRKSLDIDGWQIEYRTEPGKDVVTTKLANGAKPEAGKKYYIYAPTRPTNDGEYVNRYLYNNSGTLTLSTTESTAASYLWLCSIEDGKYVFQNVADPTKYLKHQGLTSSSYGFELGTGTTYYEGVTMQSVPGNGETRNLFFVINDDGSGFNQSTRPHNQSTEAYCTDFVFTEVSVPEVVILTKVRKSGNHDLVIPENVEILGQQLKIVGFDNGLFKDNKDLWSISLPATIEELSSNVLFSTSVKGENTPTATGDNNPDNKVQVIDLGFTLKKSEAWTIRATYKSDGVSTFNEWGSPLLYPNENGTGSELFYLSSTNNWSTCWHVRAPFSGLGNDYFKELTDTKISTFTVQIENKGTGKAVITITNSEGQSKTSSEVAFSYDNISAFSAKLPKGLDITNFEVLAGAEPDPFEGCTNLLDITIADGGCQGGYTVVGSEFKNASGVVLHTLADEEKAKKIRAIGELIDLAEALIAEVATNINPTGKAAALTLSTTAGEQYYIYSNAEIREGAIGDLLDNDNESYIHTTWEKNSTDGLHHYLRVYLGDEPSLNDFSFSYVTRNNVNNEKPKQITVAGCDTENGSYETIAVLTDLPEASAEKYESPVYSAKGYKYLRFMVDDTYRDLANSGHKAYSMAKFDLYSVSSSAEVKPAYANLAGVTATEVEGVYDSMAAALYYYNNGGSAEQLQAAYDELKPLYDALNAKKDKVFNGVYHIVYNGAPVFVADDNDAILSSAWYKTPEFKLVDATTDTTADSDKPAQQNLIDSKAVADALFTVVPNDAASGYTLSAQGLYLYSTINENTDPYWGYYPIAFYTDEEMAGVYLFEETGVVGSYKLKSSENNLQYVSDWGPIFGNGDGETTTAFTLTQVTEYTLTVPANGVTTLCLPFNVVLPAGVTAYDLAKANITTANRYSTYELVEVASEGDVLAKNTPVIIKAAANDYTLTITMNDEGAKGSVENSVLRSGIVKTTLADGNNYTFDGVDFNLVAAGTVIPANQCYMALDENLGTKVYGTAPAFVLTTDEKNPVLYKIVIKRAEDNSKVLSHDAENNKVKIVDSVDKEKSQAWYFMAGDNGGVLIKPYTAGGNMLTIESTGDGADKAIIAAENDNWFQEWSITKSTQNGCTDYYYIKVVGEGNAGTFSHNGGFNVTSYMGVWAGGFNSTDGGSLFKFIDTEVEIPTLKYPELNKVYRIKSYVVNAGNHYHYLVNNNASIQFPLTVEDGGKSAMWVCTSANEEEHKYKFVSAIGTAALGWQGAAEEAVEYTISEGVENGTMALNYNGMYLALTTEEHNNGVKFNHATGYKHQHDVQHWSTDWMFEEVEDAEVAYERSFGEGLKWATLYLPYSVDVPDGVTAYYATSTGVDGNVINLTEVGKVPAYKAVLLYRGENATAGFSFAFEQNVDAAIVDGNIFEGRVMSGTVECVANHNYYLLLNAGNGEKFYWVLKEYDANGKYYPGQDKTHIKCEANKGYLKLPTQQGAASYSFRIEGSTGVEEVKGENGKVKAIYDLQGRKLTEVTKPGFYIVDGEKVFVK